MTAWWKMDRALGQYVGAAGETRAKVTCLAATQCHHWKERCYYPQHCLPASIGFSLAVGQQSFSGLSSRFIHSTAGIILYMCPANERRRYIVTSSLIGWAQTQNDPYIVLLWNETMLKFEVEIAALNPASGDDSCAQLHYLMWGGADLN